MIPSALERPEKFSLREVLIAPVIVGALGYFVDIYDLILFSIVRVPSLKALGLEGQALLDTGVTLINLQMFGMLLGGIAWGMLGDRKGRISVLFGSIALYSVANLLNAFVTNTTQYGILRFIAGVGLAGELGAAITLVSESLPRQIRGYGTTIVATVGILGAVFGGFISEYFTWRTSYIIGGLLGIALLILRIQLRESGIFKAVKQNETVRRGDLSLLLSNSYRRMKYLRCILIGVPLWFVVGVLMTFAPELGVALGLTGPVTGAMAILFGYGGIAAGDLASGLLSQRLQNRRWTVGAFLVATLAFIFVYGMAKGASPEMFYLICFSLGLSVGYWALFVTIAAEQFGTNLRATVAISVPNFVRGSVVLFTLIFRSLSKEYGLVPSAMVVGTISVLIAFFGLYGMEETFGKELGYLETDDPPTGMSL